MSAVVHLHVPGASFRAVAPMGVLAVGGMVLLVVGASLRKRRSGALAVLTLLFLAGAALAALFGIGHSQAAFDSRIALDGFSTFFSLLLCAISAVGVIASWGMLTEETGPAPELYALILFATAGMMLMAAAGDLIVVFVALETFSLCFYVLAAFRRNRPDSQEASFKYFLTGAFSSAFLLYGIALTYGALGTTRLLGLGVLPASAFPHKGLLPAGLALVIVGLGFKVSAVPFHMWTPDAYDGAPAPISGFMAAGAKVAGYAVLLRLLISAFPVMSHEWRPAVIGLAVLTMVVGSVIAVVQTNVKRMLAYSSIAHSGFLLIGVAAGTARGVSSSLFYLAAYSFTILGAFAIVYAVGGPEERFIQIGDYRGLARRQPWLAVALALLLVSLAGIPPTLGFWSKFQVFGSGVAAGLSPLVVVGVLSSAIAAFFYLRIVGLMFLDDPTGWTEGAVAPAIGGSSGVAVATQAKVAPGIAFTIAVATLSVVVVGLAPQWLLSLADKATLILR
ncbi:MAG TPA: NADH-quinone oxidoreductase subunit N [Actinomycetota bacterium]|nr:NADH-quinone oxidoreductase subunit N [Actinomycetota bacterium]